jgi:hypothetical protein
MRLSPSTTVDPSEGSSRRQRLRTRPAAAYLSVSPSFLEKARVAGDGPRYAKHGRLVVYTLTDLDAWSDARRRKSTSQSN